MFNLNKFHLPVILGVFVSISSINSIKYDHISECEVSGRFWNGEAEANFICGQNDNEYDIFHDDPNYISNYLKIRIGTVRFQNCRFREIQRKYGIEFIHLHTFNVSGIELELLQNKTLKGARKLLKFIASNNRLTEIPAHSFDDAQKLTTIDFSNNAIERINLLSFEGAVSLNTLNLSRNHISQRNLEFISIPSLQVLDLSLNSIGNLSASAFINLPNLEHLNLRWANISNIEMKTFIHQQKLRSLDLSENQLIRLNMNLFHPTANNNLPSLSLNHNQLIELHCVLNSTLSDFVFLDLNRNNFNCTYLKQFMDFIHWKGTRHHFQSFINNLNDMRTLLNKTSDGIIYGVTCKPVNESSASKNNQFQVEYCPAIDDSNQNRAASGLSYLQASLIFVFICILVIGTVAIYRYRQFGFKFGFTPNDLIWRNSGSTVRIVMND